MRCVITSCPAALTVKAQLSAHDYKRVIEVGEGEHAMLKRLVMRQSAPIMPKMKLEN